MRTILSFITVLAALSLVACSETSTEEEGEPVRPSQQGLVSGGAGTAGAGQGGTTTTPGPGGQGGAGAGTTTSANGGSGGGGGAGGGPCTSNANCGATERCFKNVCVPSCTKDTDCKMGETCTPISWPDTNMKYCVAQNNIAGCEYRQVTKCTVRAFNGQLVCDKTRIAVQENAHAGPTCGQVHNNMDCPNVADAQGNCPINLPETCYAR